MSGLCTFLDEIGQRRTRARPWIAVDTDADGWRRLIERLWGSDWTLLSIWGEAHLVHAAFTDGGDGAVGVVSLPCRSGRFPSLAPLRPGAKRLERAIQDLTGLTADGLDDPRPWLDHDTWKARHPHASHPGAPLAGAAPYEFLPVEGPGLHRIPVGPVHAGIIEPGHFRFTCQGETVVRLEARLGYVHKGTERLMRGKLPEEAARLAGRVSGDSTVAHAFAFCLAVEHALGVTVPRRAQFLRALMAEIERIANHLNDIGAIANDAAFPLLQAEFLVLRERTLRLADLCFGHRFMMDRVVPGGVGIDLKEEARAAAGDWLREMRREIPRLRRIYEGTTSLLDRTVGTGVVAPELVHRFGAGGHVGRASMRSLDARRSPGYAPYDDLEFGVASHTDGDVHARVEVRFDEIDQSARLVEQILARLEPGPARALLPGVADTVEGMALVESFRGDVLASVRLGSGGRVERAHLRDPSWLQWPLLEAAIEGNIVADFPLCNKSFNCSYSGHDL